MAKQNYIAALDIGSGKITAVLATENPETDTVQIVTGSVFECKSLTGGIVTDIKGTAATIRKALTHLEETSQVKISALYLALRGEHIETFTNRGTYTSTSLDHTITAEDIEQAISTAKNMPIKANTEILSIVPQGFYINKGKVDNPEGMDGETLDVDLHITTGSTSTFTNLNRAFEQAEYNVTGRYYGLVCLAEAVLPQETKDLGALLIDLGKDNTSAGVYAEGALRCSYDINLGSNLITTDIAKMLTISMKDAEDIKIKYGTTFPQNYENEEEIIVSPLYSKETIKINRDYLLDIIRPRVQDIFEAVKERIQNSGLYNFANIAVLSGSGSLLPGIKEQARATLDIKNVICSTVLRELVECKEEFLDPKYSTAVALAYFVFKKDILDIDYNKNSASSKNIFKNFIGALKKSDIFGG
ncbi:MAG: cell division protein FtsA [Elusimicrobiaceae bacterium]|nr:cell division protein FtsA [Elusimicrobiaceae bacterium]